MKREGGDLSENLGRDSVSAMLKTQSQDKIKFFLDKRRRASKVRPAKTDQKAAQFPR